MRLTEAQCQSTLIDAAKRGGWRVHAQRTALSKSGRHMTAIQGDRGFPDLVIAHPKRGVWFIEAKRRPNKVEPEQQKWLDVLGADAVVAWVPERLDEWCEWLLNEKVGMPL